MKTIASRSARGHSGLVRASPARGNRVAISMSWWRSSEVLSRQPRRAGTDSEDLRTTRRDLLRDIRVQHGLAYRDTEAMSEVSLYVIDVETMKRIALEQPAVALALVTATGDQMRSLVSLADDLSLKTANDSRGEAPLGAGGARTRRKGKEVRLPASLREDDIASIVGRFRVHVSRSPVARDHGAITVDRDTICIKDVEAPRRLLACGRSGSLTTSWRARKADRLDALESDSFRVTLVTDTRTPPRRLATASSPQEGVI